VTADRQSTPRRQRLLCLHCGTLAEVDPSAPPPCCPSCRSRAVPADADDTATVTLTTHELRVLTLWAENWARHISGMSPDAPRVVQGICDRLATQTAAALTFRQEMSDLRAAPGVSDVTVYRDGAPTDE
jgi:hypothetical protein